MITERFNIGSYQGLSDVLKFMSLPIRIWFFCFCYFVFGEAEHKDIVVVTNGVSMEETRFLGR